MFNRKPKSIGLNHGQLAQAISIVTKLNLNNERCAANWNCCFKDSFYEMFSIDEHITIAITYYYHSTGSSPNVWVSSWDAYHIHTTTYIDYLKVNKYEFRLNMRYIDNFWRDWDLEKREIYHPLPNEIIQKINDWSLDIVQKKHKELRRKEEEIERKKKEKVLIERQQLEGIYKKYKEG